MTDLKIIVPISGGKDSQVCLKLAVEKHGSDMVEGLFCDTQWEHPVTYSHVDSLAKKYDVNIVKITGGSVPEKVQKYSRFPLGGARFCTDELKIRETKLYLKELSKVHKNIQVWYGMRSDESAARAKRYTGKLDTDLYEPHEVMPSKYPKYLGKAGVRFMLPILSWSEADVFEFLNGEENPLYSQGFDRVGCFPCLAAGDSTKIKAFEHDDFGREQYKKVLWLEKETGRSAFQGKKNQYGYTGCSVCSI